MSPGGYELGYKGVGGGRFFCHIIFPLTPDGSRFSVSLLLHGDPSSTGHDLPSPDISRSFCMMP